MPVHMDFATKLLETLCNVGIFVGKNPDALGREVEKFHVDAFNNLSDNPVDEAMQDKFGDFVSLVCISLEIYQREEWQSLTPLFRHVFHNTYGHDDEFLNSNAYLLEEYSTIVSCVLKVVSGEDWMQKLIGFALEDALRSCHAPDPGGLRLDQAIKSLQGYPTPRVMDRMIWDQYAFCNNPDDKKVCGYRFWRVVHAVYPLIAVKPDVHPFLHCLMSAVTANTRTFFGRFSFADAVVTMQAKADLYKRENNMIELSYEFAVISSLRRRFAQVQV